MFSSAFVMLGRCVRNAFASISDTLALATPHAMWQLASPGEPLQAVAPSMAQTDLLAHARLQANYLNEQMGRKVVGGSVLAAFLQGGGQAVVKDLGSI